jgi:hypothetical protein
MAALADRRKNVSAATRSDRRSVGPGRQTRLFGHEPAPVGASVDPLALLPGRVLPTGLVVGDETVSGDVTVGIVGTNGAIPTVGNTLIVGTAAAELTPRLPISKDPNGIPVRAPPPGVVGDVDVGVDDEAMLLDPEPHIPDVPEVSSVPEVVDIPDVPKRLDEVDIPDVDAPDVAAVPDIAALPAVVALAGAPIPIPPPSKLAVDPNIDDGEVPTVEHAVPPVVLGIAIVPVTPMGAGLSPGEVSSVEPSGMPVGSTEVPGLNPNGEVAPREGVVAIAPTCAMASLQANSAGRTAAISENRVGILRLRTAPPRRTPASIGLATISLGVKLSDIGQSLVIALRCRW